MAAKFVVEEGDLKGLTLSLDEGDSWTIGQDPSCQIVIDDPAISSKHLVARRTSEGIFIDNLSEENPVFLNDEPLDGKNQLLQNGDTLKIGNELLRFYEEASAQLLDTELADTDSYDEMATPMNAIVNENPDGDASLSENSEENVNSPNNKQESEESMPVEQSEQQDTHVDEENEAPLAQIDFGFIETGRWLLKVISGPNNGAEFYMQEGNNYVIGTDPQKCDLIFYDNTVSHQHAMITVTNEDTLAIEDLKSRNGVMVNGQAIQEKQALEPNDIVTLGTTSFVIYDREGEMKTIVSPFLLPSIIKVLQQEANKETTAEKSDAVSAAHVATVPDQEIPPPPKPRQYSPYIILTAIISLFVLAGIGTSTLFKETPIVKETQANADQLIQQALEPFPAIRWTFNKSNRSLLLLGHLYTGAEKNQLLYNLEMLDFIKNVDSSGIIIDEGVWNEVNTLLSSNPAWSGITIHSPAAGQFILSGELKTRKQAEQLSSYLSLNFPYLDLLKKQIVVEEDVVNQVYTWLKENGLNEAKVKMNNGEITLDGTLPANKTNELNDVLSKVKQIPGVRVVTNSVRIQTADTGIINLSDHYTVTGKSRIGDKHTVVINGKILGEGDELDGMMIKKITANRISLEKAGDKFRIDY